MVTDDTLILCIEDDVHLAWGIQALLELEGYKVITAGDGLIAIDLLKDHTPNIIISDIMMPKMDGYDFLKTLRGLEAKLSIIPVIFLTARGDRGDILRGLEAGVDDYICKPFEADELLLRVATVLSRRQILTSTIQLVERDLSYHIFLSYSRKDTGISERVCNALRASNLKVWIDTDELKPGTASWRKEVQKAIEQAGCVVVLLSPDAKESKWVEAELDYAETQEKLIMPVLVSGTKSTSVPFGFTLSHLIDISQNDFDSELQKLVLSIRKQLKLI